MFGVFWLHPSKGHLFGRALFATEPADDGRKTNFSTWHVLEREVGINVENTDER